MRLLLIISILFASLTYTGVVKAASATGHDYGCFVKLIGTNTDDNKDTGNSDAKHCIDCFHQGQFTLSELDSDVFLFSPRVVLFPPNMDTTLNGYERFDILRPPNLL